MHRTGNMRHSRHVKTAPELGFTVWVLRDSKQAVAGVVADPPNREAIEVRRFRTDCEKRAAKMAAQMNVVRQQKAAA